MVSSDEMLARAIDRFILEVPIISDEAMPDKLTERFILLLPRSSAEGIELAKRFRLNIVVPKLSAEIIPPTPEMICGPAPALSPIIPIHIIVILPEVLGVTTL